MNSKLKLALVTAAFFTLVGVGAREAYANARPERMAQTPHDKNSASRTDQNKTAPGTGCSLLTIAMIEKVLGQPFPGNPKAENAMAMYGGASGWRCTYLKAGGSEGNIKVDFVIYEEASAAKAKQDFDKYSVAADDSKGKPSIGDSAYWVTPTRAESLIYVLKGKVHFSLGMRIGGNPATETQLKRVKDLAAAVAARI